MGFVSSQKAVLESSNVTASFCRDGNFILLHPSCWVINGASETFDVSAAFFRRLCGSTHPDLNPEHFLSCAQGRRSSRGCHASPIVVIEADIADARLALATKTTAQMLLLLIC